MKTRFNTINGSSVELNNCLTEARGDLGRRNANERAAIQHAIESGMFVVVCETPYHCRATDAVAGMAVSMVGAFATYDEACTRAQSEWKRTAGFGDDNFSVLPEPASPVAQLTAEDEIPF